MKSYEHDDVIDSQGSNNVDTEDNLDPFMFCLPRYFVFNEGTYDLMVKDLLGIFKVTVESLKDVAKGMLVNFNAWRHLKSQLMLKNEEYNLLKTLPNLRVSSVDQWR